MQIRNWKPQIGLASFAGSGFDSFQFRFQCRIRPFRIFTLFLGEDVLRHGAASTGCARQDKFDLLEFALYWLQAGRTSGFECDDIAVNFAVFDVIRLAFAKGNVARELVIFGCFRLRRPFGGSAAESASPATAATCATTRWSARCCGAPALRGHRLHLLPDRRGRR